MIWVAVTEFIDAGHRGPMGGYGGRVTESGALIAGDDFYGKHPFRIGLAQRPQMDQSPRSQSIYSAI